MNEFEPRERVKPGELFAGHSFEDECAWEPLLSKNMSMREAYLTAKKNRVAGDFATQSVREYIAQDFRGVVRSFTEEGERFSAYDFLPGSVLKLDMCHVYGPLGGVQTYNDSGVRFGVVVSLGDVGSPETEVKIAVARKIEIGSKRKINFDMHEAEIKIDATRHLKLTVPARKRGEETRLQDLYRVRSVHLLSIGKGQRPSGGGGKRFWGLLNLATGQKTTG